jgi:hypothetical protein
VSVAKAVVADLVAILIQSFFARRGDPGAYWRPAIHYGSGVAPISFNK